MTLTLDPGGGRVSRLSPSTGQGNWATPALSEIKAGGQTPPWLPQPGMRALSRVPDPPACCPEAAKAPGWISPSDPQQTSLIHPPQSQKPEPLREGIWSDQ